MNARFPDNMGLFSSSPDADFLLARLCSSAHGVLSFCLSTLRAGDLSRDRHDKRESFLKKLGISPERVVSFRQTHSKQVAHVSLGGPSPYDADGGITEDPAVVLSITVADCLPIVLYDKSGGGFAMVHSGWKGTGIVIEALAKMRHVFGSQPKDIAAFIGPGIGSCCYDVPEERADVFESYGAEVVIRREGTPYLDLKEANTILLARAGVTEIKVSDICTSCTDSLGSYRREGPGKYTRMLAVAGHF